ncbi:MAG: DoxX family protein, partial [Deltaproteobacteria bacterium]|nr:DoxX family protein [Deltaproteobacteria bacterium]
GAMVMLGLWTRWAALALAGVMLVATSKTFFERGFINAADFPFSLLTSLLALMFLGGGSAVLKDFFSSRRRRGSEAISRGVSSLVRGVDFYRLTASLRERPGRSHCWWHLRSNSG